VAWTGVNDQDGPHNRLKLLGIWSTFIPAGIALACTYASSAYMPGISDVTRDFDVSEELAILAYVLFVIGMGGEGLSA